MYLDIVMSRRILYVQFTDPAAYPPIEHSSRLFAERGWEVFMVGMDTAGALNLKLPVHPRIRREKIWVCPRRMETKASVHPLPVFCSILDVVVETIVDLCVRDT